MREGKTVALTRFRLCTLEVTNIAFGLGSVR
jgi:hypothetical protein